MFAKIRSHAPVLGVAAAALTVGLIAPAAGHGVSHALFAHNADKLDGLNSTAFARASVVKTTHGGVGWQPYGTAAPAGFDRLVSGVSFDAGGSMVMPLDGPGYQNRKTLGLAKIELLLRDVGHGDHLEHLHVRVRGGHGAVPPQRRRRPVRKHRVQVRHDHGQRPCAQGRGDPGQHVGRGHGSARRNPRNVECRRSDRTPAQAGRPDGSKPLDAGLEDEGRRDRRDALVPASQAEAVGGCRRQ